jgi:hypothetical protein
MNIFSREYLERPSRRLCFFCFILAAGVISLPADVAKARQDAETTGTETPGDTSAEAKGSQDLSMIAQRMEFLSGQLNRMPNPPKLDATLVIPQEEETVLGRGSDGHEADRK